MKIPKSFLSQYEKFRPTLLALQAYVAPKLRKIVETEKGFFFDRIKSPGSFLIKSEKGEYKEPFKDIEDLYACTIVVSNITQISTIIQSVEEDFKIFSVNRKLVKPQEFVYDDYNLNLQVIPDVFIKNKSYIDVVFELQIKTLLQKAWGEAGHDLIYKGKKKSYGLDRISSQLRALLEMADAVLANLEKSSEIFQKNFIYEEYQEMNYVIDLIQKFWEPHLLPDDMIRMSKIIINYLSLLSITFEDLETIMEKKESEFLIKARSLTPTQCVFILIFKEDANKVIKSLTNMSLFINITDEMYDLFPELEKIPDNLLCQF